MGDIVHALPTLATVKENFPEWEVDWLIERRWRELLRDNPYLSRVLEFDTLRWRRSLISPDTWGEFSEAAGKLRERNYDCALDLQGSLKSAMACRLSGAVQITGFERPWLREPGASVFYTRRITPNTAHIVDANLALAESVGARQAVIRFPLPTGDEWKVPPEWRHREIAVINPGAGWQAKQWPPDGYAQICDELDNRYGLSVIVNCGPHETVLAEEVLSACRRTHPGIYSGNLGGLIWLLRQACLMIGPDTGPLHLAAALGVPTVGLFGPTDPKRNGPYGNSHRNLRPEGAVTSHHHSGPADELMVRIRPTQVLDAIHELLQNRSTWPKETGCIAT